MLTGQLTYYLRATIMKPTELHMLDRRGHSSSSHAAMSRHDIIAHAAIGNWFAANGLDSTCITNSHPATMTWLDDGDG